MTVGFEKEQKKFAKKICQKLPVHAMIFVVAGYDIWSGMERSELFIFRMRRCPVPSVRHQDTPRRRGIFVNERIKRSFNQGQRRLPYFWRDNHGREIDCIIDHGASVVPIEIKSGKTVSDRYFKNLEWWQGIAKVPIEQNYVVYGGDQSLRLSAGRLLGWRDVEEIEG